jgi:hypothetical protein
VPHYACSCSLLLGMHYEPTTAYLGASICTVQTATQHLPRFGKMAQPSSVVIPLLLRYVTLEPSELEREPHAWGVDVSHDSPSLPMLQGIGSVLGWRPSFCLIAQTAVASVVVLISPSSSLYRRFIRVRKRI